MSQAQVNNINGLLEDKLFQVIGSTPASVAESLKKIDIRGKADIGGQIFAVCIFSSAVNKATLETFLSDARFSAVRQLLTAALSIQGRANMTALTLLGHCFLTTDFSKNVTFAKHFKAKMGQDHLWASDLKGGSLSEKQRAILSEKRSNINENQARALGSGFLKWTGILKDAMTNEELTLFSAEPSFDPNVNVYTASPPSVETMPSSSSRPSETSPPARSRILPPRRSVMTVDDVTFNVSNSESITLPSDVLNYRRNVIGNTDQEITDGINTHGIDEYINRTRRAMAQDPDGRKARAGAASTVGK